MPERLAPVLYYLEVHLLYASGVWLAAWVLTSIPRGSATTKYWIWVATSLNFTLPVGAVLDRIWTSHLGWARPLGVLGAAGAQVAGSAPAVAVLSLAWSLGAILMLARLGLRIRAEGSAARSTASLSGPSPGLSALAKGVPVKLAEGRQAPAVNGVLRPHISLPDGIDGLLNEEELRAVLIHELTHARRRDNLIRLIYEVGLCGLWFHPLVWLTGSRLALYRELSCDEPVIQSARAQDLVSALAKLANPEDAFLLQATASSFLGRRLARLVAGARPEGRCRVESALLAVTFGVVLSGGVLETVAHTACCFVARIR